MTIVIEAEHVLGNSTPAAFAKYVEVYWATMIPAMNDVGYNLVGAWRQVSGPLGRDLFLTTAESMAAMEKIGPRLLEHKSLTEGMSRWAELGFTVDEVLKNGRPFEFADDRRLQQGAANTGSAPRCYRLIRRHVGGAGMAAASEALSDLADELEDAGSWQLFTAYQTTYGDRREMSEIWIADDITREWYPKAAGAEALAALDAATREASMHLLDPLPFSKAR
ncbi:hypothetical protein N8291_05545 [Pseudomonadales bacterium]|nr:hypothetical protein [Pseudomonadales bacterium]MDC3343967.1 hypothetical protein [Pseudomonadales bacterium]